MASTSGPNFNVQQPYVPVFDGKNYDFWCVKMKTSFLAVDLWDMVEIGYKEPEIEEGLSDTQKKKLKEARQRNANALSMIQRAVVDSIFPRIMRATTAQEAWKILQKEYLGDSKVRAVKLQSLRRQFENTKMKDNETLKEFSDRFIELVNQMKTYGEKLTDQTIMEKVLMNMPEKFDNVVSVIEQTKDLSTLSVEELMGSLKVAEQRLIRHSEKPVESAFQSQLNLGPKNSGKHLENEQNGEMSSKGGRFGKGGRRNSRGRGRGNFNRNSREEGSS